MVLGLAVLGLALIASPVLAANLFTINETGVTGVTGSKLFVPTFVSSADSTGIGGTFTTGGIYIPFMGTMTPCTATIGNGALSVLGDCARWGQASIEAWASGVYYDPRFGTPFIPPSGDHHRTGYRLLMQPSFSGGQWMSGFAPLEEAFPFFPQVGLAGAGGDMGLALADASAQLGLVGIMAFLDGHGEPLTTGKFPRYWAHERAAWTDTLMVKYTAGGGVTDLDLFSQSLRSSAGFARNATDIRWRAMSNLDGAFSLNGAGPSNGCGASGWCEFYVTEDTAGNTHLFVIKNSDANTDTADGAPVEITQSTRLDTIAGFSNGGMVLKNIPLNNLEKLPFVIDDRLAQYSTETGVGAGEFEQQLLSQIRIVSGPNVHSEEGADPYSWVICGTRGATYGEDDCADNDPDGNGVPNGGIDSGGNFYAIVYNADGLIGAGESPITRYGRDVNPNRVGNTHLSTGLADDLSPDTTQSSAAYVECTPAAATQSYWAASTCESDPGTDGFYGTPDDGTVYYKEALENGLRGWIRETNGHAFSFLGADTDGTHNGVSPANFGLSQIMVQSDPEVGFLLSCIQCSPHDLPIDPETVTYTFNWPGLPAVTPVGHPPATGTTVIPVLP
jgi:hypothetical protein